MASEALEKLKCTCPICGGPNKLLGTIPFERNNAEVAYLTNREIDYYKCEKCNFISCPEMLVWTAEDLGREVYNDTYVNYDPDYIETRPTNYAISFFNSVPYPLARKLKHLDYGGGSGIMASKLREHGWNSPSYDPYYEHSTRPTEKYNLITAIEVVEHALDIRKTFKDIISLLTKDGMILFSTQLANKSTDISWWYIGARNGHISILSKDSLKLLAIENGMYFQSVNEGLHIFQPSRTTASNILGWNVPRY